MTKPSIDRIIRESRAECLVLSQGEAKVMVTEIVRLRDLFKKVQDHCAGDALPRWDKGPRTTNSRGYLLDICNNALD